MDMIRGVNLGNWLVLEKWMHPDLFAGTSAEDETDLCIELGEKKHDVLREHRESYVTRADFEAIAAMGLTQVRLPVPHFVFDDYEPYVGCIDYVDAALEWAQAAGLRLLIDLHTAPDSQNGFDNGGICGVCKWHTKSENIDRTVMVLEKLAARYKDHPALFGIELLNEPVSEEVWNHAKQRYLPSDPERAKGSSYVPLETLVDFYERAYAAIRRHMDDEKAVMFHDGFRLKSWKDVMRGPEYRNVILDTHVYLGFALAGRDASIADYMKLGLERTAADLAEMREFFPVVVGEWSLTHDPRAFGELTSVQREAAARLVGSAQLYVWEQADGWYFWSYKLLSDAPHWDFRRVTERGWLPRIGQASRV